MTGMRFVLATVGVLMAGASAQVAEAGDAPTLDVDTIARDLEARDGATRAAAARALGARYPEAACTVPVLLDAVRDEVPAVRTAAVRALRRLGRAGQEDAAKAWGTLGPEGLAHHEAVFGVLQALGAAVTPTDLTYGFAESCSGGTKGIRAGLLGLAADTLRAGYGDPATDIPRRDQLACVAVAMPWLASSDAATARTAAAVVAILGRSAVADVEPGAPTDAATESSEALLPLLSAKHPAVRFATWRLLAIGAPHPARAGPSMLAAAAGLPEQSRDGPGPLNMSAPLEVGRRVGEEAVRRLGAAARPFVLSYLQPSGPFDGPYIEHLLDVGARDEARAAWKRCVDAWRGLRQDVAYADPSSCVFAVGRDPALASEAVASLPALLDTERRLGGWKLLALVDPQAPPDDVPRDSGVSESPAAPPKTGRRCLALAWLAHRVPVAEVDEGIRVRTAAALRRALVQPGGLDDRRLAAAVLADLAKPGLVPAATLLAALKAEGTRNDVGLTVVVLQALAAVGGVSDDGIGVIAPLAATPPTSAFVPGPRDRIRYASGWPFILPALEVLALGADAESATLRRLAAIDALGAVAGDTGKAKALLAPLTSDPDARVRLRAARALRRLGA